ncbi:MAG TPA: MBL fold metallo-hydrolase [Chitinophagaceae bacterium]|nr:MBL fold metallo-hydrolase [Chitinophagaceae bacterium]
MQITFHGAARVVTGSKHLITLASGRKLLLDCGMFQGGDEETGKLNQNLGFDASTVDWMVLSHAHIDHCGLIPKLVREGFKGPIYCTPATLDLVRILLLDSAEIQESDARYMNKKVRALGLPIQEPLYGEQDVKKALPLFRTLGYGEPLEISPEIRLTYSDVGHIIGAAAVNLQITEGGKQTAVTFSGDVGRYNDIILKSPEPFPQADFILLESTYGNSLHEVSGPMDAELLRYIQHTCLEKKGKLIIPAFSVGRTQELLYQLNGMSLKGTLPDLDIFVDSPLSEEATEVVKKHPECFNSTVGALLRTDADPFSFPRLKYAKDVSQSKAINNHPDPCVIISASGMADAGRVKHHIANNISDPRNTILIVGYCEPRSLGGRLGEGARKVTIYGTHYEVQAEVGKIRSMSAHGDYRDLIRFLGCQDLSRIRTLFLVHGEYPVQQDFRQRLLQTGLKKVEIPAIHESWPLV